MSSQQKHLDDGTGYVGQLGELAYDPDEDKVQCHLCGGWYRAIGNSHLPARTAGRSLLTVTRSDFPLTVGVREAASNSSWWNGSS